MSTDRSRNAGTVAVLLTVALVLMTGAPADALARSGARTAPIRTVRVPWGQVGYRAVGSGSPLLLLNGGGDPAPSVDDWPPSFVDRLARSHRVLVMDYEGIGRTTRHSSTVTITQLADDAKDFVDALGIRRLDVLGWSMGGFVAQSLAIRYRSAVRRLVLCASAPGDGTAAASLVRGTPAYPAQWLFPFGDRNRARADAFEAAVHAYPNYYQGSPPVPLEEGVAIATWLSGDVPEGHLGNQITAPTLIGDGRQDVILPVANSEALARTIRHSLLTVYEDAGHAFLVQHERSWTGVVDRFLRGSSASPHV